MTKKSNFIKLKSPNPDDPEHEKITYIPRKWHSYYLGYGIDPSR